MFHGVEYAFGAHEHATTGIFEVEPRKCPGFTFRKSILIGRTDYGPREVRSFIEKLATEFTGNSYNLITRNCNHFCNDMCLRLTKRAIPSWVNRLARLGFLCNCVLPASLNDTKVRQIRAEDDSNTEKKLRTRSNRFASTSKPQQQVSSCSSSPSTTKNQSSGTNIKPLTTNKDNKR
ncbi:hypothetical protein M8C21_015606 [Ambrosia artemisiifolia]|uniref:PPPDE domain-containing protein n=1 Tax=Ambrosia artemisiifolia TaxID=4212 RepID=A0AAD5D026_AMBAR|nr:hypothetical protein M8C21_015606 [Ambrosia artemisiifolia]